MDHRAVNRYVNIGDIQLYVRDWGGDGLPPLFVVHGLASTHHIFDLIAPALTDRYHVFAMDQRGHGLSDKPDNGYDFETIAHDLDLLADALGVSHQPLTMIGHSWGAYTTLYYAATRTTRAHKTVLLDGGFRPLRDWLPTWDVASVALAPPPYDHLSIDDIKQRIRRWQGTAYRPEIEPLALSIFDVSDPQNVHAHLSRENNMQIARYLWEFAPTDYYPRLRAPLLIVSAIAPGRTLDPKIEQYARRAETLARDARVVWMPDTIHDIPWHRPQELIAVLNDFL